MTANVQNSLHEMHALVWVAFMAALIAIGGFITLPIGVVPFTLQTFFVSLAGLMLGAKKALYATLLYLGMGVIGLPVFSGGKAGFAVLFSPTGGFLVGFLLMVLVIGVGRAWLMPSYITDATRLSTNNADSSGKANLLAWLSVPMLSLIGIVLVANTLVFVPGVAMLMYSTGFSFKTAIAVGVIPFIIPGIAKAVLAVVVWRFLKQRGFSL